MLESQALPDAGRPGAVCDEALEVGAGLGPEDGLSAEELDDC